MIGRILGAALFTAVLSCRPAPREREQVGPPGEAMKAPPSARVDSPPPASARASAAPVASVPVASAEVAVKAVTAPAPALGVAGDVCRVVRGPVQAPFTGQATLWIDEGAPEHEVRVIYNQNGSPRAVSLPAPPAEKGAAPAKGAKGGDKKPERLALSEPAERAALPPCAFAGGLWFCADAAGNIHRMAGVGVEGPVIAEARPGAMIAAAPIGGSRVVYAYLADRKTTEGSTTVAMAAIDGAPPETLSEDGAGATFVTLAPRGDEVIALYLDQRRVLTPVHARIIRANGKIGFGPDAVIFVGGGSDGRLSGAVARGAPGNEFGLLALDKDDKEFGMAAVRIDEPPRDDARVTWSLYPAAMERAPFAVTQGAAPARVLRVRPAGPGADAKRVLELGELDASGGYKPSCPVAEGARFADPAIAVDRRGALWIAYTDADGTWIERRGK